MWTEYSLNLLTDLSDCLNTVIHITHPKDCKEIKLNPANLPHNP